jgi:hypothetical protein
MLAPLRLIVSWVLILNPLYVADGAKRIALRDPNVAGNPVLAIMDVEAVEEFSDADMKMMTEKIFRTLDPEHTGVVQGPRDSSRGPFFVLSSSDDRSPGSSGDPQGPRSVAFSARRRRLEL